MGSPRDDEQPAGRAPAQPPAAGRCDGPEPFAWFSHAQPGEDGQGAAGPLCDQRTIPAAPDPTQRLERVAKPPDLGEAIDRAAELAERTFLAGDYRTDL